MTGSLLVLGAGQYGSVVKETAQAMGCFDRIDFLDDHNPIAVGKIVDLEKFVLEYDYAFVAIGNSQIRMQLLNKLEKVGFTLATLIHPHSVIMSSAKISGGTIVEALAVINTNTEIKKGCIISAGAVINHDCCLEDGCHVDCNATVSARSFVPKNTKISCGEVFI